MRVVHRLDRRQHVEGHPVLARGELQRFHVLRKTASAVARARVKEVITDPRVGADPLAHGLDVGTQTAGQIGDLVHERYPRSEHRVRCVLGELGRADVHHEHAFVASLERRIYGAHRPDGARVAAADNDAIRPHEILDRGAFLQEFRIRHDGKRMVDTACRQCAGDHFSHTIGGADRHGRFVDHDLPAGHPVTDRACRFQHVLHVGAAIFVRRRADGDELHRAMRDGGVDVGGETQPPSQHIALDHRLQARLVNRHTARFQDVDLARVDVEAQHVVPHFGETGAGD